MSQSLSNRANKLRGLILKSIYNANSGHPAGSLGIVDLLLVLFNRVIQYRPQDPSWPKRDRLVLSCGHLAPALYAVMADCGYFKLERLNTLRKFGSALQGHPDRLMLPGVEFSSGPLGQGFSVAVGMAEGLRLSNSKSRVYLIGSDGEHNEGQVWEAIQYAGNRQLDNLTLIIDRNKIQLSGNTETVMALEPLAEKYRSFNWHVIEVNGHDFDDITTAFRGVQAISDRPTAIIAHTIPGKGVEYMEHNYHWHGKIPNKQQLDQALYELEEGN